MSGLLLTILSIYCKLKWTHPSAWEIFQSVFCVLVRLPNGSDTGSLWETIGHSNVVLFLCSHRCYTCFSGGIHPLSIHLVQQLDSILNKNSDTIEAGCLPLRGTRVWERGERMNQIKYAWSLNRFSFLNYILTNWDLWNTFCTI